MLGILARLLVLVSFLIFVGWIVGGLYLDSVVKNGVETVGPEITGTTVSLDDVNISVVTGQGRLKGLVVRNPKGFYTDSAYNLGDTKFKFDPTSLFSGKLIIEEIVIDSPEITYEVNSSGNNLDKIRDNVKAFGRSQGLKDTGGAGARNNGSGANMVQINHFIVKNATLNVSASLFRGRALTFPMDDVHLRDIGKESGGVSLGKAASQMLAATNKPIAKAVPRSSKVLKERLKGAGKAVKRLRGTAEKRASDVVKAVKEFFGKVGERVGVGR